MRLTQHFAVLILLVEVRESGEYQTERGDDDEEAGDNGNNLTKVQSISLLCLCSVLTCLGFWSANANQCYTINNRNISIDIAHYCTKRK